MDKEYKLGSLVTMKKDHPCGFNEWEVTRLGADIKVEGKVALVNGVKRLSGATVCARDLRGAAALVIAGLGAEGTTTITGLNYLDRGYENIEIIFNYCVGRLTYNSCYIQLIVKYLDKIYNFIFTESM